jgi:hypothetical protein
VRQHPHLDVDIRFTYSFQDYLFYCTTPMPNQRVEEWTEPVYEGTRLLNWLARHVQCGGKE